MRTTYFFEVNGIQIFKRQKADSFYSVLCTRLYEMYWAQRYKLRVTGQDETLMPRLLDKLKGAYKSWYELKEALRKHGVVHIVVQEPVEIHLRIYVVRTPYKPVSHH